MKAHKHAKDVSTPSTQFSRLHQVVFMDGIFLDLHLNHSLAEALKGNLQIHHFEGVPFCANMNVTLNKLTPIIHC